MSRFELSVSPNYVKNWTYLDGIREIFQNAIDQERLDESNAMQHSYNSSENVLTISSMSSVLEKSSLLFGNSSKADDANTIGQFGEGYKLALLVLLREGFKVIIHNYHTKEQWVPKFIKSRRYGSQILVVDVHKYIFMSVPDANLTFEIVGITEDQYAKVIQNTLQLQTDLNTIETDKGTVLLDKGHVNKLFVNGLFVCESSDPLTYGYNFKPKDLRLDRDRLAVNSFDVVWQTSTIWASIPHDNRTSDLVADNAKDIQFIGSLGIASNLSNDVYDKFNSKHGATAIPVSTGQDVCTIIAKYPKLKPVVVPNVVYEAIEKSNMYKSVLAINEMKASLEKSPTDILREFQDNYEEVLGVKGRAALFNIIDLSENWIIDSVQ